MKTCISCDLEGVAGVVNSERQCRLGGDGYEQAKSLATQELNAIIEGLLEEKVEDILVLDGHGPGGLIYEEIHERAKLMHGRPIASAERRAEIIKSCDFALMAGRHAMAGTEDGNLCHTMDSRRIEYFKLNGELIGEIGLFSYFCGALDVPLIFVSGDDAACREASALMPGIKTVSVKQGLSRTCAISCSKEEARQRLRLGAADAVRRHLAKPLSPLKLEGPYKLEKCFLEASYADSSNGVRIGDRTIEFKSEDNLLEVIYGK